MYKWCYNGKPFLPKKEGKEVEAKKVGKKETSSTFSTYFMASGFKV